MANFSAPCLAMYMPFKTQELNDNNGTYYGINKLSQNPIIANRKLLDSYHGMILGKTRSGSFSSCIFLRNSFVRSFCGLVNTSFGVPYSTT